MIDGLIDDDDDDAETNYYLWNYGRHPRHLSGVHLARAATNLRHLQTKKSQGHVATRAWKKSDL